jgi:transposase
VVGKWRGRFVEQRLNALADAPRPGRPRSIDDDKVEEVVVATLESMPKGASRWSTRDMAKKMGISPMSVSRIWRAFELKPHRAETFQLSTDPEFIAKVRDVVGPYMNPPTNAIVLSVDEKSQVQALERTQPLLPMRPGQLERRTPEYQRHGTTTLFAALDVATGNVMGKCFRRHRAIEFVKFLDQIDKTVSAELAVHIVVDNYGSRTESTIQVMDGRCVCVRPGCGAVRVGPSSSRTARCSSRWTSWTIERVTLSPRPAAILRISLWGRSRSVWSNERHKSRAAWRESTSGSGMALNGDRP